MTVTMPDGTTFVQISRRTRRTGKDRAAFMQFILANPPAPHKDWADYMSSLNTTEDAEFEIVESPKLESPKNTN